MHYEKTIPFALKFAFYVLFFFCVSPIGFFLSDTLWMNNCTSWTNGDLKIKIIPCVFHAYKFIQSDRLRTDWKTLHSSIKIFLDGHLLLLLFVVAVGEYFFITLLLPLLLLKKATVKKPVLIIIVYRIKTTKTLTVEGTKCRIYYAFQLFLYISHPLSFMRSECFCYVNKIIKIFLETRNNFLSQKVMKYKKKTKS